MIEIGYRYIFIFLCVCAFEGFILLHSISYSDMKKIWKLYFSLQQKLERSSKQERMKWKEKKLREDEDYRR